MWILGRDVDHIRIFHLHHNWSPKNWFLWTRAEEGKNAKRKNAHGCRRLHSNIHDSIIFLLHGFAQSKKWQTRIIKDRWYYHFKPWIAYNSSFFYWSYFHSSTPYCTVISCVFDTLKYFNIFYPAFISVYYIKKYNINNFL